MIQGADKRRPNRWKGSNLQWWQAEAEVSYGLPSFRAEVVGGLRWDKTTFRIGNPAEVQGQSVFSNPKIAEFNADLTAETFSPYFGLSFLGPNYKARLLCSPATSARINLPFFLLTYIGADPRRSLVDLRALHTF